MLSKLTLFLYSEANRFYNTRSHSREHEFRVLGFHLYGKKYYKVFFKKNDPRRHSELKGTWTLGKYGGLLCSQPQVFESILLLPRNVRHYHELRNWLEHGPALLTTHLPSSPLVFSTPESIDSSEIKATKNPTQLKMWSLALHFERSSPH